jgi:hypothetical protein
VRHHPGFADEIVENIGAQGPSTDNTARQREGMFHLQQVPLAFGNRRGHFLALRCHWIAGEAKGNDLDITRLGFLAMNVAALEAARIPGAFAELGVWRGNSAKVIHSLAPLRELYLLDTFKGFPSDQEDSDSVSGISHHYKNVSVEEVRDFVGHSEHIHWVVGRFPDSAGSIPG